MSQSFSFSNSAFFVHELNNMPRIFEKKICYDSFILTFSTGILRTDLLTTSNARKNVLLF